MRSDNCLLAALVFAVSLMLASSAKDQPTPEPQPLRPALTESTASSSHGRILQGGVQEQALLKSPGSQEDEQTLESLWDEYYTAGWQYSGLITGSH